MKYKKYPKYKDSGIEWLREIPEHWEVIKGKFLFKNEKIKNDKLECMDRLALTLNGVIERKIDDNEGLQPSDFKSYQIVYKNDLIFKLIDLENYKTSRVGLVWKKGIMSPAYIRIFAIKNLDIKYYYYYYFNLYLRGVYNEIGNQGVRSSLNAEELLNIEIPLPSLSEQKAIASFLDKQIEKIDTLIKKEEELIKLLEEKKEALITKAVTKGLKNSKMKDSGIEWLGEILEHWEIRKIYHLFKKIGSGTTPSSNKPEYYENGNIFWLQTGDLNDGYINQTSKKINEKALKDFPSLKIYPPNSLVIAMYGATIGKLGILNIYSTTNQACCVLSNYKYDIIKYIFYLFLGVRKHIISLSYGGGQPNISQETIKNLKIPLPPLQEQKQIAEYLDKKLSQIDKLIEKSKKAIELLKEKKESLITNAVTGKIDVRNINET